MVRAACVLFIFGERICLDIADRWSAPPKRNRSASTDFDDLSGTCVLKRATSPSSKRLPQFAVFTLAAAMTVAPPTRQLWVEESNTIDCIS